MAAAHVAVRAGRRPVLRLAWSGPWLITGLATAVSTYALDAVATAAGVVLAASQLLHGLDHILVLLFLAGTYVLWGAGLRVNLRANRTLLERTGTSTNLLSKAAHDLVKSRSASRRARRMAADAGYVGTELAKEAPYYAGACGAALLTDSVSANDALIFLGGANLGAAAYEYGLAGAVRAFLHRRGTPGGTLIMAALRRSRGYRVGGKTFPSADVDENNLRAALAPCFGCADLAIEVCELPASASKGYTSIVLARAHAPEFTDLSRANKRSNHGHRVTITPPA